MEAAIKWEKETIPYEGIVYRQIFVAGIPKINGKRVPNEAHFIPDPDGLSVHWSKYITIEQIYYIIALSFNKKGDYINYTSFKIYQFPISFLRDLEGIIDIKHDPVINGNPAPIGHPNNRAHTLVIYPNDEEIRLNIADFVRDYYDNSYCDFDIRYLENEIKVLRERLNDTEYHKIRD